MNRLSKLILVIALLITCYGCFIPGHGFVVPGDDLPGVRDGGGRGDRDGGGRGDHDRGRRGDKDRERHD